jgi:hypothetical protein
LHAKQPMRRFIADAHDRFQRFLRQCDSHARG